MLAVYCMLAVVACGLQESGEPFISDWDSEVNFYKEIIGRAAIVTKLNTRRCTTHFILFDLSDEYRRNHIGGYLKEQCSKRGQLKPSARIYREGQHDNHEFLQEFIMNPWCPFGPFFQFMEKKTKLCGQCESPPEESSEAWPYLICTGDLPDGTPTIQEIIDATLENTRKSTCGFCAAEVLSDVEHIFGEENRLLLILFPQMSHLKLQKLNARVGDIHFRIRALSQRLGESATNGHYVAWVKTASRWIVYNDDKLQIREDFPRAMYNMALLERA